MAFAIAVENPKYSVNIGTLCRSAFNFGAAAIFTVGRRYRPQSSDTIKTWRHLPLLHFETWDDYRLHAPYDWRPIVLEMVPEATLLPAFVHPDHCVYVLGPEDGSVSWEVRNSAAAIVNIPSQFCLNVSVAAAVVMYDRIAKRGGP